MFNKGHRGFAIPDFTSDLAGALDVQACLYINSLESATQLLLGNCVLLTEGLSSFYILSFKELVNPQPAARQATRKSLTISARTRPR